MKQARHQRALRFDWPPVLVVGTCLIMAPTLRATANDERRFELSGRVNGASGQHVVHVALWDAEGFLDKPVDEKQFAVGSEPLFRFDVSAGRYALSAFEDTNDNGVLDKGMFGPKEPSGFWRPFHAWRKPRFADVATLVQANLKQANIELH